MRLGIVTPLFTRVPGSHARWEEHAQFADIVPIVEAADRLGYHHATCSEHVVIPEAVAAVRGGRYWDPLAAFGYLAARTEQIRFATHVLVLGYHHPLEIAKRYGTLDQVSGGRVILGVGVGSLQPEFELLGAAFEDRGARGDEALRALRTCFGRRLPEFHGEFYDFSGLLVDPAGIQQTVPLWIGGRTPRSLRRAVELADGWVPFGLTTAEQAEMITRARDTEAWDARQRATDLPQFEVVMGPGKLLAPVEQPEDAADALRAIAAAGATMANLSFRNDSPAHYIEQLEAMAAIADR